MSNKITSGVFILFLLLGCSESISKMDSPDPLQTFIEEFYDNGSIRSMKTYYDGELDGLVLFYYPNGILKARECYVNGKLEGRRNTYWENGARKEVFMFRGGKREGLAASFHRNNELLAIAKYENDEMNGLLEQYDSNGVLIARAMYENSIQHGPTVFYNKDSSIQSYFMYNGFGDLTYRVGYNSDMEIERLDGTPLGYIMYYDSILYVGDTFFVAIRVPKPPRVSSDVYYRTYYDEDKSKTFLPATMESQSTFRYKEIMNKVGTFNFEAKLEHNPGSLVGDSTYYATLEVVVLDSTVSK